MNVYEAVTSRRAVRAFTDQPVPAETLRRVLAAAVWAPSGSNLQPWRAYVLTGQPLAELKKLASERTAANDPWDDPQYQQYPPELKSLYPATETGLRRTALRRAWHRARQLGSRPTGRVGELGMLRRARCSVLLHRP